MPPTAVILFDGVCNLCNGFVQFVIRHDPPGRFRFASFQSAAGQELLLAHGLSPVVTPETVLLIEAPGQVSTHSTAALRILRRLRGWSWLGAGLLVPRLLRDAVYRLIARNRYRWFGQRAACMVPTPALRQRFL